MNKWLVQYNLAGLQKPYKLFYQEEYDSWWDKTGDFGGDAEDETLDDIVTRYFDTEAEAKQYYTDLNTYREFIKRHL